MNKMSKQEAMRRAKLAIEGDIDRLYKKAKSNHKKLNTKDINKFTKAKGKLIIEILETLPLDARDCPFCRIHQEKDARYSDEENCKDCEFGKKHAICVEDYSDYFYVDSSLEQLINTIKKLYKTN